MIRRGPARLEDVKPRDLLAGTSALHQVLAEILLAEGHTEQASRELGLARSARSANALTPAWRDEILDATAARITLAARASGAFHGQEAGPDA